MRRVTEHIISAGGVAGAVLKHDKMKTGGTARAVPPVWYMTQDVYGRTVIGQINLDIRKTLVILKLARANL